MTADWTPGQRRDCDARGGGFVYLVGAGPGDPDLLTLKAVKALRRAQVVLCDDLVGEDVLAHAPPEARVVRVGKRGGCQSTPQEFIERLMVAEARAGRIVVRLKGGDPMIFGRGGEECAALRRAGIPHEVVNGITSGLAGATAAGIPLTHREHCHGVTFVTGHGLDSRLRGNDGYWEALVRSGHTLVVYMGVAHAAAISAALLGAGMRPSMPVAAIAEATLPGQRVVATTLAELPAALAAGAVRSPAVLVFGEVASLAILACTARDFPAHSFTEAAG